MTQTLLRLGGQTVAFTKSEDLIAVRPSAGMAEAATRALHDIAPEAISGETLGGFQIVKVDGGAPGSDEKLDLLRADSAMAKGTHVFHTSDDGVPFVPTGVIFIAFNAGVTQAQQEAVLDSGRLQVISAPRDREILARVTTLSPNPLKVAELLQQSPHIEVCEPEFATPAARASFNPPSGGMLADQWHLRNVGQHRGATLGFLTGADARVIAAWNTAQTIGSSSAIIAVIDDGFDLTHPDLSAVGKIVHPWDFTRRTADPSPDLEEGDWHGTACAGVALAQAKTSGVYGAAPGATLMPVRWGNEISDSQLEAWFDYVASKGAWVVSCSWKARASVFRLSTRVQRAISRCASEGRDNKGCVILFAAGNDDQNINDPMGATVNGFAIHPDVIAVAASNSRDEKSDYSNFGAEISICAPSSGRGGWGILTCDVTGSRTLGGVVRPSGYADGDYTLEFGGTSSATPLAAGVCALVLSVNPSLTAAAVKALLERTARKIGGLGAGQRNEAFGHGCVDADAAVTAALASRP
ncbi:S8 family serine peptidase [Caulobacter hibisci]|uniref:S8 family serine peptidase n=1 Tax=Caulobacter hibisci TaxID=2035993 RepID=A0ABS0T1V5_9CAUL|nr:S8 family serine peptidase [Caulobacter hibisci]MBI1685864.1 S8 family serine peptidase [Caulobacter hibisci]